MKSEDIKKKDIIKKRIIIFDVDISCDGGPFAGILAPGC